MNITDIAQKAHENAVEKGFWDRERELISMTPETHRPVVKEAIFAQKLALIQSEVSEALEARREGRIMTDGTMLDYVLRSRHDGNEGFCPESFRESIKNTDGDELADAVIRIFDLAVEFDIDIEWHLTHKHQYNTTRPRLHGKAY